MNKLSSSTGKSWQLPRGPTKWGTSYGWAQTRGAPRWALCCSRRMWPRGPSPSYPSERPSRVRALCPPSLTASRLVSCFLKMGGTKWIACICFLCVFFFGWLGLDVVVLEGYKIHWAGLYPLEFSWMSVFLIWKLYAISAAEKLPAVIYVTLKEVNQNDLYVSCMYVGRENALKLHTPLKQQVNSILRK